MFSILPSGEPPDCPSLCASDEHALQRSLQARSFYRQGGGLIDLPLRASNAYFLPVHPQTK